MISAVINGTPSSVVVPAITSGRVYCREVSAWSPGLIRRQVYEGAL
ncbi:hypothetical protein PRZ61_02700 [Halomonas pacifica]|nr:hypothetical protein [Halomonas pacifica]MDC8802362.1 hypothetical protein [Halomonas pacifica]